MDEEAEKLKQERLASYAAKKAKKPTVIAKSNIVLDVSVIQYAMQLCVHLCVNTATQCSQEIKASHVYLLITHIQLVKCI